MSNKEDAKEDQNVFDITQGVSVIHALRLPSGEAKEVFLMDLKGPRSKKYEILAREEMAGTHWKVLTLEEPLMLFAEVDKLGSSEYMMFYPMQSAFNFHSVGVQTSRDHLAIGFTRKELKERIDEFCSPSKSDTEIRSKYFPGKKVGDYLPGDTRGWSLSKARVELRKTVNIEKEIMQIHYRPYHIQVLKTLQQVYNLQRVY